MSRKLDLVLVNPGNRTEIYQSLASELTAIEPPIWASMIATFVRNHGFSVQIVDGNAEELLPSQVAERVAEMNPRLVAIVVYGHQPSASTQNMTSCSAICSAIKKHSPDQKAILVGGHVASLPERTLTEEAADYVSTGEGLYTIIELLAALASDVNPDLSKVRGLLYRDGGFIRRTPAAPLLSDLDGPNGKMPGLAWDLLPMHRYRAHNWHCFGGLSRKPYAAIYTTLGCPYKCTFCCIQAPFRDGERELGYKSTVNSYRFWSVEGVIAQIDKLVNEYGVRNIKIADEMFVLNPKHVMGICDAIIERKYDLNIWAYARVDTVRDQMIDKLRRAGVTWLAFGIEAASERVRDDVQKGFDQDDIFRTLEKVRAAGIHVIGNYIFGLPEDDLETMQATLDLAIEANCEFANFYCTMAYPGSPLYEMAIQNQWELPDSWSGYSQHSVNMLPLRTKHLSAAEVIRFRDRAFHTYFTNPRYLDMVTQKFGEETAREIREMTSHKLVRKYA